MATLRHALLSLGLFIAIAYSLPAGSETNTPSLHQKRWHHHKALTLQRLQAAQPLNGLPANNNVTLVYSTLGIGTQNYTCNGTAFVQTEAEDGAVAQLYDTTDFLRRHPRNIDTLAQHCNYQGCKFPALLNRLLGNHFFSALHAPVFSLADADPPLLLTAAKVGDVPAPGPNDIDWLLLTANATAGPSEGLTEVYRIDTFGGKAPSSCRREGRNLVVPYTAQYWFYE